LIAFVTMDGQTEQTQTRATLCQQRGKKTIFLSFSKLGDEGFVVEIKSDEFQVKRR
jgi:hypothetical protein